jgi:hypothetical protein
MAIAQRDFPSLELAERSDDLSLDAYQPLISVTVERMSCLGDDNFVPVNFIPDAVCTMIKNWELSELERQNLAEVSDPVGINRVSSVPGVLNQEDYEPTRCMREFAPPKRFYRTFWKSISRKLLQRVNDQFLSIYRGSTIE